jgi:hypothetical protein
MRGATPAVVRDQQNPVDVVAAAFGSGRGDGPSGMSFRPSAAFVASRRIRPEDRRR